MLNMLNPLKDTKQFHDSPLRFLVLILSLLPALEGGNIAWGSHLALKQHFNHTLYVIKQQWQVILSHNATQLPHTLHPIQK